MTEPPAFDAYHELLGIAPSEQPPHLYRLLGITPFEASPTVIERAADRQMAHLRNFQAGKHQADSQRLLNEISKARQTLLNEDARTAYDAKLKTRIAEMNKPPAPLKVAQALPAKPLPVAQPVIAKPAVPQPSLPQPTVAHPVAQPAAAQQPMLQQPTGTPFIAAKSTNRRGAASSKNSAGLLLGGGAAGILLLVGGGLLFVFSGGPKTEPLAQRPKSPPEIQDKPKPSVSTPTDSQKSAPEPAVPAKPIPAPVQPTIPPQPVDPGTPTAEQPSISAPPEPTPAVQVAPPPVRPPPPPTVNEPSPSAAPSETEKAQAEVAAARAALPTLPKFKKYYDHLAANPDTLPTNGPKLAKMLQAEVESNASIREHAPSYVAALQEIERLATAGADYKLAIVAIDAQATHSLKLLAPAAARLAKAKVIHDAADAATKQKAKSTEREALLECVRRQISEVLQEEDVAALPDLITADAELSWTAADRLASIQFLLPHVEKLVNQDNVALSGPLLDHLDAQLARFPAGKSRKEALDALTALRSRFVFVSSARTAEQTLAATPDDPAANQTVGLYLLLNHGKWRESLTHLAMGSEPEVRTLAAETQKVQTTSDKTALADRWSTLPRDEKGAGKEIARRLFQEALDDKNLVGIARAAVEAKAKELGPSPTTIAENTPRPTSPIVATNSPKPPPTEAAKGKDLPVGKWVELQSQVDIDQDLVRGHWHKGNDNSLVVENLGQFQRLRLPALLRECSYDWRIDFRIGTEHSEIHFVVPVGDRNVVLSLDAFDGATSGFTKVKGKDAPAVKGTTFRPVLPPNSNHRLEISVRLDEADARISVVLNGAPLVEYAGPIVDLDVEPALHGLGTHSQPGLMTVEAGATYLSNQVRLVKGSGSIGRDVPLIEPIPTKILAMRATSLTTLKPNILKTHQSQLPTVNEGTRNPLLGGKECKEYIFAHAPCILQYDIPSNAKYFTAIAYAARSASVKFIVRVDGKELFSSEKQAIATVVVPLPSGAKILELECDPMGDWNRDHACWCYPAFREAVKR